MTTMTETGRWTSLIREEATTGFGRFAGTILHGTLALPGAWLNRQSVKAVASGKAGPITGLSIALLENQRAVILIALDRFPLPRRVELPVLILPVSPEPRALALEMQLEPSGWLRMLLPLFAPLARGQGLALDGNRLRLRLADFAENPIASSIAAHVREIQWATSPGSLHVNFFWEVPDDGPISPGASSTGTALDCALDTLPPDGSALVETDQTQVPLVQVSGTLCVSESLVGEVLAGVCAALPGLAGSASPRGSSLEVPQFDLGPVRLAAGKAAIGIVATVKLNDPA